MAIDWDQLIATAESDLAKTLTAQAVAGLVADAPWISTLGLTGVVSWGFGLLIALGVKYGDWITYLLGDDWKNSSEARSYEKAASANASLPQSDAQKAAAIAAQKTAFDALIGGSAAS